MTAEVFNKLLESRLKQIVECLGVKANEYATDDILHNFKEAANTFSIEPSEACWSYMMKHLISIKDMVDGTKQPTPDMIREKIGDAINYLILMEAILTEGMETNNVNR